MIGRDDKPGSVMIQGNGEDTVCLRELLYVQLQRSAELMGIYENKLERERVNQSEGRLSTRRFSGR